MIPPFVKEYPADTLGMALIIAGPHGAGKDTIARRLGGMLDVSRIVRHITRPPTPEEVDGVDYHFVDDSEFDRLAERGEFVEHAAFIGCKSGTSSDELYSKLSQADFASLTSNFEDGLKLHRLIGGIGLQSVCFFVSPCSRAAIEADSDLYLSTLRERMMKRGRASDLIDGRLQRAAMYRELYLENTEDATYVDNSDGRLVQASEYVARVARATKTLRLSGEV